MSLKARIGLMVEAQGARRAAGDVDHVARSVDRLDRRTDATSRTFGRARSAAGGLTRGLLGLARATTYGALAGAGLAIAFGRKATLAWEESRKVAADTAQTIRSTGGAANVTAKHVAALSGAISGKTGVDDEAIQAGANMLLTFKQIRNEAGANNKVFDRSVGILTDLSVKMGNDPKRAAIQLGKALNDPVRGLTALTRVGVTFDDQQREQIESMVKAGDVLGAQKIMLRELSSEFGGAAAAQATPLDKLKVSAGNLTETIGSGLQPATDWFFKTLKGYVDRAIPIVEKLSKQVARIFGRDDLSLEQKLHLTANAAQRAVGPVVDTLGGKIRRLLGGRGFGEMLGEGFENAAPYIANHAAHAAPRVVSAFVNAWLHADGWGKLITLAFLAGKLGAFRAAGGMTAGWFATRFTTQLGPELDRRTPAMTGRMNRLGGALGTAMSTAAIAAFGVELYDYLSGLNDRMQQRGGIEGVLGALSNAGEFIAEHGPQGPIIGDVLNVAHGGRDRARRPQTNPGGNVGAGTRDPLNPGNGLGQISGLRAPSSVQPAEPVAIGSTRWHPQDVEYLAALIAKAVNDKQVVLDSRSVGRSVRRHALHDRLATGPS